MVMLEGLNRMVSQVDLAMGTCERLIVHQQEPENGVAAPMLFFILLPALFDHLLLTAAKLYEKKGDRSMHKLLRVAGGGAKEIPWKDRPFTDPHFADAHPDSQDFPRGVQ